MPKLYGDVPKEHIEIAKELEEFEIIMESKKLKPELLAKGYVCMAHDYFYTISDDDKGGELLEKAEKVCPGYFDNQIKQQIKDDEIFEAIVSNLTLTILEIAKSINLSR